MHFTYFVVTAYAFFSLHQFRTSSLPSQSRVQLCTRRFFSWKLNGCSMKLITQGLNFVIRHLNSFMAWRLCTLPFLFLLLGEIYERNE
jgi:hypothetical protein